MPPQPPPSGIRTRAGRCLARGLVALCVAAASTAPSPAGADEPAAGAADAPRTHPGEERDDIPALLPQATSAADGLYVEFGRGVNISSDDDNFTLTIRGRLQTRGTWQRDARGGEDDLFFQARRVRLVFLGTMRDQNLQMYLQLGMGASDLESDRQVPLRDAVITWTPFESAGLRVGQMKVPFSRERIISSSALQLADRSIVNAEFNLDRDVGVQVFSNDVFDLGGKLAYQLGVFGGDGRNRANVGTGLLYAARLQYNPFGDFDDSLIEADLTRARNVRLSFGLAGGFNQDARRTRSTHGPFYDEESFTTRHASVDVLLKYAGFSLQSEAIFRDALRTTPGGSRPTDGDAPPSAPRSGWGWMAQAGYVTASGFEVSGRWAQVFDLPDARSEIVPIRRATLGLGQYVRRHDLKIQADYGVSAAESVEGLDHEVRVQLQVYF